MVKWKMVISGAIFCKKTLKSAKYDFMHKVEGLVKLFKVNI